MHRQESQEMGGFLKKLRAQLPTVLSQLCLEPSWGLSAVQEQPRCLAHPSLCPGPGAVCLSQGCLSVLLPQPSWAASSPIPPLDPLLSRCPSKAAAYDTTLPAFIFFANALPALVLILTVAEGGT